MWHGRTDERTDGHKNFWSLTFVSMTHVSIMTLRYIVSEIHTDRQAKYIYIDIYMVTHHFPVLFISPSVSGSVVDGGGMGAEDLPLARGRQR